MIAAYILMVISWTAGGPVYSMSDVASKEACDTARVFVYQHTAPSSATVLVKCIDKQSGQGN